MPSTKLGWWAGWTAVAFVASLFVGLIPVVGTTIAAVNATGPLAIAAAILGIVAVARHERSWFALLGVVVALLLVGDMLLAVFFES